MNKLAKRVLSIVFQSTLVVLLIAAALYFIPWPTRVNVQMTGIEVTADGTYKNEYTIQLTGWKLNYLFRDDTAKFDVQITGINSLNLNGQIHTALYHALSDEFDYHVSPVYFPIPNHFEAVCMCLDKNADWLVINAADRYFVASTDPNADLQTYWKMCADYIQ